jgi:hypothetical protein
MLCPFARQGGPRNGARLYVLMCMRVCACVYVHARRSLGAVRAACALRRPLLDARTIEPAPASLLDKAAPAMWRDVRNSRKTHKRTNAQPHAHPRCRMHAPVSLCCGSWLHQLINSRPNERETSATPAAAAKGGAQHVALLAHASTIADSHTSTPTRKHTRPHPHARCGPRRQRGARRWPAASIRPRCRWVFI